MGVPSVSGPAARTDTTPPPPVHVVDRGETLGSIAKQYGVSLKELQQANPQVRNPDVLYPGQQLTLPADALPAQPTPPPGIDAGKATRKGQETSQTDDDGNTRKSGSKANVGVGYDPNTGATSLSAGQEFTESVKNSKGVGLSFGIGGNAKITSGQITKNGMTTYTSASDVSVSLKAGVSAKQASVEVGHTDGIKASYQVSIPEQAAKTADLTKINPFDPSSMPTGTKITMDGSNYATNEFKASFRNLAVQTKVTNEQGVSTVVTKTGDNRVKIMAGPKEMIEAYNGFGVDFDAAKVMLGRNDRLAGATLKTAEFDLSTPEGKAAYNDYLANGNLPKDNGPGISGVATTEKVDYSSQSRLDLKLGPLEATLGGAKNTGNWVTTTYPDGSKDASFALQYSGNVPMIITSKFDAAGNEIVADRRYSYTIQADKNIAQLLNAAQTGDLRRAENGPVREGQTVTLNYTQDQMRQLMQDAQAVVRGNPANMSLSALTQDYDGKFRNDPQEFAIGMARNLNSNDYGFAERLYNISMFASNQDGRPQGFTALPGSISTTG